MIVSATLRNALNLAPALAAAALLAAPGSASASTTSGDAFGICRAKVRATFGEEAARLARVLDDPEPLRLTGSVESSEMGIGRRHSRRHLHDVVCRPQQSR